MVDSDKNITFVCISDTHTNNPNLPKGDVLIHAGFFKYFSKFSGKKKKKLII